MMMFMIELTKIALIMVVTRHNSKVIVLDYFYCTLVQFLLYKSALFMEHFMNIT